MSQQPGFEIDFLAVGEGERSGDAIALRYGLPGAYTVMVVDGGNKEAGQQLVDHIKTHYQTNHVHFLVNTHPDGDHASGLEVVLENLSVGQVWVHQPWNYPEKIHHHFIDDRITFDSLRDRLQEAMRHAYRLEELAVEKGIPVYEPFQGSRIGEFEVLSPSRDWYLEILPHFNKTPETHTTAPTEGFLGRAAAIVEKVKLWVDENWDFETLKEGGSTSFDNESSVVLFGYINGQGILLTGDAGNMALARAADFLRQRGVQNIPETLHFIQIPHHGSRHNVGPNILNRLLGKPVGISADKTKRAYVSAGAKSETHPRRVVTNAFQRRGAKVYQAKGSRSHIDTTLLQTDKAG